MSMEAEAFERLRRLEKRIEAIEARLGLTTPKDAMAIGDAKGVPGSLGPMTTTFASNSISIISCMMTAEREAAEAARRPEPDAR